jgi:CheY-like chemotaxis protein
VQPPSDHAVPLDADHPTDREATPAAFAVAPPLADAAKRLLIVDDEHAILRVMAALLCRQGYEVELAGNGTDAFHRLQQAPAIDLVVTDQTMPAMTGAELIEQLRAQGVVTPVILMSGYGAAINDDRIARLAGVCRLDKPFMVDDLLRTVAHGLASSFD